MMRRRLRLIGVTGTVVLVALMVLLSVLDRVNRSSGTATTVPPSLVAARRELAGSPRALADLHDQAEDLLGSRQALAGRLAALRGYPVVLNAWASWCGPCRGEFAIFAVASVRYGRQVAFLGVDTNDSAPEARGFLALHPVSYPSYQSSSAALSSLAVIEGLPTTIVITRAGKVVQVHAGQYETPAALYDDIQRYALGGSGKNARAG